MKKRLSALMLGIGTALAVMPIPLRSRLAMQSKGGVLNS